ncbi:serine hydrolase domain-containing protein [Sphingobacterium spiritivorum]|uniref:serine hydrolase domain-containing protein n=1 Tax=Sphingobacterium spiritivorum TaxID=258 RepID=UPI003DA2C936
MKQSVLTPFYFRSAVQLLSGRNLFLACCAKPYRLILVLICCVQLSYGQQDHITRLDRSTLTIPEIDHKVRAAMDSADIPGLNLAILNHNIPVFIKSYGYRDKFQNELMDTTTLIYAASFSKAVFGYLSMLLVQERQLDLDKPLYQYLKKPLPEYPYFSDLKEDNRWKLITARMCLSHTTGLPNVRWFDPRDANPVFDSVGVIRIYFQPGKQYAYSGEGFKLLQLAVEEITGKNLDELATEKIFKPIGMTRSGYIWHDNFGDKLVIGHNEKGQQNVKRKRTVAVAGGSMVTTIADYTRFIAYVTQGKGLEKKYFEQMISPQIDIHSKTQFPPITKETTADNKAIHLAYGLGWGLLKTKYGRAFFKEGGDDAWKNYNINFIDKGVSIIIMTNSVNGSKVFKELLETLIADTFTPWKWEEYYPYNYR